MIKQIITTEQTTMADSSITAKIKELCLKILTMKVVFKRLSNYFFFQNFIPAIRQAFEIHSFQWYMNLSKSVECKYENFHKNDGQHFIFFLNTKLNL